jgi:hypothetical protein
MARVLSVLGTGAALVFMTASGWMNVRFMTGLARTPADAIGFGAASIAVTVSNAAMPFFLGWAWDKRRWFALAAGAVLFPLLLGASLLSAFGFAATNRGASVGGREGVTATYEAAKLKKEDLLRRLAGVAQVRAIGVVEAEIKAAKQERPWASSKECTEATVTASRGFCKRYETLVGELQAAKDAKELRREIDAVESEMAALREGGAGQDADPQASLISKLSGVHRANVQLGWELMFALLLELGAAFLPYLAAPELSAQAHGGGRGTPPGPGHPPNAPLRVSPTGPEPPAAGAGESRWVENAKKKGLLRK